MKTFDLAETTLDRCVAEAGSDRVVLTRDGKPVALVVGVEGLDEEQLELGSNFRFWTMIEERRRQKTVGLRNWRSGCPSFLNEAITGGSR